MKTHNRIIYHCLRCGSVVHSKPDDKPPKCCGQEMRDAAVETIYEPEDNREEFAQQSDEDGR